MEVIFCLESRFAEGMLLHMMRTAEADRPSVRWLHPHAPISAHSDMGTFDRQARTACDGATMTPDPGSVAGTGAGDARRGISGQERRKAELRHLASPSAWRPRRAPAISAQTAAFELLGMKLDFGALPGAHQSIPPLRDTAPPARG